MAQFVRRPAHNPKESTINKNAVSGEFISSKSTILSSGPPCLDFDISENVIITTFPVGLVQTFGLGVTVPMNRVPEIGSFKWYFLRDREVWGLTINHALMDRGSLSKLLYSYYLIYDENTGELTNTIDPTKYPDNQVPTDTPNSGGHFMKLGSTFFEFPFGLHLDLLNSIPRDDYFGTSYSQWYIENVYIQAINFGITAGSSMIMESLNFQVGDVLPIPVGAIEVPETICVGGHTI